MSNLGMRGTVHGWISRHKKQLTPYIFISPFFILFLIFGLYPITYSIYLSFLRYPLDGTPEFVGIRNYISLFTTDPFFGKSLLNTVVLLITGSLLQHFLLFHWLFCLIISFCASAIYFAPPISCPLLPVPFQ